MTRVDSIITHTHTHSNNMMIALADNSYFQLRYPWLDSRFPDMKVNFTSHNEGVLSVYIEEEPEGKTFTSTDFYASVDTSNIGIVQAEKILFVQYEINKNIKCNKYSVHNFIVDNNKLYCDYCEKVFDVDDVYKMKETCDSCHKRKPFLVKRANRLNLCDECFEAEKYTLLYKVMQSINGNIRHKVRDHNLVKEFNDFSISQKDYNKVLKNTINFRYSDVSDYFLFYPYGDNDINTDTRSIFSSLHSLNKLVKDKVKLSPFGIIGSEMVMVEDKLCDGLYAFSTCAPNEFSGIVRKSIGR